jgi:hypothetical protein
MAEFRQTWCGLAVARVRDGRYRWQASGRPFAFQCQDFKEQAIALGSEVLDSTARDFGGDPVDQFLPHG